MAPAQPLWSYWLTLIITAIMLAFVTPGTAISNTYCSTLNTAGTAANSSIFQSMGLCSDFCFENFAFAVLQVENCWCSDYAPASTSSTEDCSTPCPGYPDDLCGGGGKFGYVQLAKAAVGTKGGNTPTPIATPPPASIPSPVTVTPAALPPATETIYVTSPTTIKTTPAPVVVSKPPPQQDSSTPLSTWTPTVVVSLETVTGQVRTITVTPTAPPNTVLASSHKSKGLSTGAAVGVAIAVVLIIAIICGMAIWFWLVKRRRREAGEEETRMAQDSQRSSTAGVGSSGGNNGANITRSMSENSRFVLASNGKMVVGGLEPDTPGSGSSRLSTHGLKPVDQRLNPWGAYRNQSRESVNTVHDSQDYSRRILGVTNPDTD